MALESITHGLEWGKYEVLKEKEIKHLHDWANKYKLEGLFREIRSSRILSISPFSTR